jgi:error-prone DNA polymerase
MFQHLHIHSHYSLMWGTAPLEALADYLEQIGQKTFPLADRNSMHGLVKHLQLCKARGLKPIVGAELVVGNEQALCLVKTQEGYRNLCRLLTERYRNERMVLHEALADWHRGLVIISCTPILLEALYPYADQYIDLREGQIAKAEALHQQLQIPMVVTSRGYMISPRAYDTHLLLRAIDTNTKLSRLSAEHHLDPNCCLPTPQDMMQKFAAYPEAIKATQEIIEACEFAPGIGQQIFPPSVYESSFKELRERTYAGLHKRYDHVTPQIRERADYELDMIRRKGFSNCFLVIEDVVRHFTLTCGRGSAAASIVSYALFITHVDPIAENLFFERFLNPGRQDPPDIDIDFAWDERDQVRDYLWHKYGGEHIAMVCNHNFIRGASAIREVAKVYGISDREIRHVTDNLHRLKRVGNEPDLHAPWPHLLKFAKRLVGQPRNISVHCGGVVITPDPIYHHCSLQPMPIGYDVVPWEKDAVEDYGFVKLDFLGNRSLAVVRDCLRAVRQNYKIDITYERLNPTSDMQTQNLIRSGNTMGCFYVESPATRQLLQKTGHGDFRTLVAISSIIRPAANKIATEWVLRHRHVLAGKKPNWKVIHPKLEEVLEENHGLMVYQEDVSRAVMAIANFNATDADRLRKIISKKDKQQQLADYHRQFVEGCKANGLNDTQIEEAWEMVMSFAGYSFCKPHSASYALVSFKSAFLKFHYPAEFLAAVISNRGGFYSTFAYLSHARRLGVRLLGPDINHSHIAFTGYQGTIRIGFMQIRGLSQQTQRDIVTERHKRGAFCDLDDFLHRVEPPLEEAKKLVMVGCFDALEATLNRPTMIWRCLHWFACHQNQSADLFPSRIQRQDMPEMAPYSPLVRLKLEMRLLGLLISAHPLHLYRKQLKHLQRIFACDIHRYVDCDVVMAGWLLTGKTTRTKDDAPMSFLTFEDETHIYETVMFPDVYQKRAHLLSYEHPFLIHGTVTNDMGSLAIVLKDLRRLDQDDQPAKEEAKKEEVYALTS